ncbi:MAG TPA: hypothetical protein PK059_07965 [Cyclobacteriaceae bacterium]|jgi:hypothetical protein|nr:hypothetical protein [Cyclobacteriaceae bacterium]
MKYLLSVLFVLFISCSPGDPYQVSNYYNAEQQDEVLTSILTYILDAPPYTAMKDRFAPEHRFHYSKLTPRFSIEKYFKAEDGTHYFYVIRPTPRADENRAVGGHFRMTEDYKLTDFKEVFVTPALPMSDIKGRCSFLFDEMVKGDIEKYLAMESYVQWPNVVSYYDTITYEWKMKPEFDRAR